MCGIGGIVQQAAGKDLDHHLRSLADAMRHRGPDKEGFFKSEGVGFCHRRLSIIDLSQAGNQPMTDPEGRFTLIFNGEIYNFRQIRQELNDYPFDSENDAEVLLAAWRKWGKDCLEKLAGMFAFAIWDNEQKSLTLVRDRLGIKPLYYSQSEHHLVFASEVRAILRSGLCKKKLNTSALEDFFRYQTVSGRNTILEDIQSLGAGELLIWKDGKVKTERWWDLTEVHHDQSQSEAEVKKQVLDLLRTAVSRRMISDVPLGAFLSGGIDSSAVVALMAEVSSNPVNTFSVNFEEKQYDESKWSGLIAKKYNTQHHPILLNPSDFLDALPDALSAMDHPSGDGINSYVVSKTTKAKGITVALSGLGGDELFAGYPIFSQLPDIRQRHLLWKLPRFVRKLLGNIATRYPGGRRGEQMANVFKLYGNAFEDIYPLFRQIYSGKAKILKQTSGDPSQVENWLSQNAKGLKSLGMLSKISAAEIRNYTEPVLLRDTDQMSMAHSLEVRVPFFDHQLVEYVLGLPDSMKTHNSPKALLVAALGDRLPPELVNRKKMGFVFPWDQWLRGELKNMCDLSLRRLGDHAAFDGDEIQKTWKGFLRGEDSYTWVHIWLMVVLSKWMEINEID